MGLLSDEADWRTCYKTDDDATFCQRFCSRRRRMIPPEFAVDTKSISVLMVIFERGKPSPEPEPRCVSSYPFCGDTPQRLE